mgnify:CR=1 FL=1
MTNIIDCINDCFSIPLFYIQYLFIFHISLIKGHQSMALVFYYSAFASSASASSAPVSISNSVFLFLGAGLILNSVSGSKK